MRKICAWCRQPMDAEAGDLILISHGICDSCLKNALVHWTSLRGTGDMRCSPTQGTIPSNRKRAGSTTPG